MLFHVGPLSIHCKIGAIKMWLLDIFSWLQILFFIVIGPVGLS